MGLFNHFCLATVCLFNVIHGLNEPQSTTIPPFYYTHQIRLRLKLNTDSEQESKELSNKNNSFTEQTLSENVDSEHTKPTTIDTTHEYNNSVLTTAIKFLKKNFTSDFNDAQKYDIGTESKYDKKKYQNKPKIMESRDSVEQKHSKVTDLYTSTEIQQMRATQNNLSAPPPARRIYRGHRTKIKHFPFMVTVHVFNKFVCGGSIIASDLVITAASCLKGYREWLHLYTTSEEKDETTSEEKGEVSNEHSSKKKDPTKKKKHPKISSNSDESTSKKSRNTTRNPNISVRVGTNYYRQEGKVFKIKLVYIHPSYQEDTLQNNLVILKLDKSFDLLKHPNVKKINIRTNATVVPEGQVTIVGWGAKTYYNKVYNALWNLIHKAVLNISDIDQCIKTYTSKRVNNKTNFCASNKYHEGACDCDVGDPAVADYQLVGITSFGSPNCGPPNATTVFTNLSHYTDWLRTFRINLNTTHEKGSWGPQTTTPAPPPSTGYKWPCLRNGSPLNYSGGMCQTKPNLQLDRLKEYQNPGESSEHWRALEDLDLIRRHLNSEKTALIKI